MPPGSSAPVWKGSLARLRAAGCPSLEPVLRGCMPHEAILVLDHNAINDVVSETMTALTGAGYNNKLIVPELALDFFDKSAKNSAQVAFHLRRSEAATSSPTAAVASPLRPKEFLSRDSLQLKKGVLLQKDTYRVAVQRVEEYDKELLAELGISPRDYDTRLYVLCALYFKKKEHRPTVIVTSDPVVVAMAAQYGLLTCPAEDICNCGSLIEQHAAKKEQTPKNPVTAARAKPGVTPKAQQRRTKGKKA